MANEQDKFTKDTGSILGLEEPDTQSTGQYSGAAVQRKKDASGINYREDPAFNNVGKPGNGKSLIDQAKNTAGEVYDAAAETASAKLDEQKATISGSLSSVADSIRKVGENVQTADVPRSIGKFTREYSNTAAQKFEQAANYFESKDLKEIYRDVETFARNNPAIFIGGAFALGLLAARFLKSSSPHQISTNAAGQKFASDRRFDENFGGSSRPASPIL